MTSLSSEAEDSSEASFAISQALKPRKVSQKALKTFSVKVANSKSFAKSYIEDTKSNPVNLVLSSQEAVSKWAHLISTARTFKASAVLHYAKTKVITILKNRDTDPAFPGFCYETLECLLQIDKSLGDLKVHINLIMPDT